MATLTNTKVKDTYQYLLKLNASLSTSLGVVEDGLGNDTALQLSTTGVGVGALSFVSAPSVDGSAVNGLFLDPSNAVVQRTLGTSAFVDTVNLSAGTGISVSGTYPNLTITNTDPDKHVSFNVIGSGISVAGAYPIFDIENTAPDQVVSIAAGNGLSVSGAYPNFTLGNTAPDQTVTITAGTGMSVSGTYPNFTVTNTDPDQQVSIGGLGGIVVGGSYPNFTVDGSNVQAGVHEEMIVGTPENEYPLGSSTSQIISFSNVDNSNETTSYHFGTAPAQLQMSNNNSEIENISGQRLVLYIDMSAYVGVDSPNSDISYLLERFSGGAWNAVKNVTRYKGFTGEQVDSFWGIFNLDIGEKVRVIISSDSGNVRFLASSQIKFEVKETGNII